MNLNTGNLEEAVPVEEAPTAQASTGTTALTTPTEVTFHFREKTTEQEDGTKTKVKRASLPLKLPNITVDGLVDAINEDDKVLAYLVDEINQAIYNEAKVQVDANEALTQEGLDLSLLTVGKLARKPKSEGRGGGIPKELWAEFVAHYVESMPKISGVNTQKATTAAGLFNRRLADVKSNKKILEFLQGQLALWFTSAEGTERFAAIYEVLESKATLFLEDDGESMLGNLM